VILTFRNSLELQASAERSSSKWNTLI